MGPILCLITLDRDDQFCLNKFDQPVYSTCNLPDVKYYIKLMYLFFGLFKLNFNDKDCNGLQQAIILLLPIAVNIFGKLST